MSSSIKKFASTLGAIGGGGIAFAADKMKWDWPEWLLWLVIVCSVLCLIWASYVWFQAAWEWFLRKRPKPLIPLLEFVKRAQESGWDFGPQSAQILDLTHGIEQAALLGNLTLWGRPDRNKFERLAKLEKIREIPKDHWDWFLINSPSLPRMSNNFLTRTYSRNPSNAESAFIDLHLDRKQALSWLRREADEYKGMRQRLDNESRMQ